MKAKQLAEILLQEPDAEVRMALDFKTLWGIKVKKGVANGNPIITFYHKTTEYTHKDQVKNEEEMKVRS